MKCVLKDSTISLAFAATPSAVRHTLHKVPGRGMAREKPLLPQHNHLDVERNPSYRHYSADQEKSSSKVICYKNKAFGI